MRKLTVATTVALTLATSFAAMAVHADTNDWNDGPYQVRVRGVWAFMNSTSDAFSLPGITAGTLNPIPGDAVNVNSSGYPELSGEYFFAPHWSTELAIPLPTSFDVKYRGAELGSIKTMPNTLTVKYQFADKGDLRPYLGLGAHMTWSQSEALNFPASALNNRADLQTVDKVHFGAVAQAGLDYRMARNVFLNADVRYLTKSTQDVNYYQGAGLTGITTQPWLVSVGISYRFGGSPVAAAVVAAPVVAAVVAPKPAPAPAPAPVVAKVDPDSDGDGVPDSIDQCPNTPRGAKVDKVGCACDVTQEVHFATGSAVLTAEDKAELDKLIPTLKKAHFINGEIEGHTDSTGGTAMNQKLSVRRADAVAAYLAGHGISEGRITTVGFGETKPVDSNATKEGRAHNRRVVIRRTDCAQ